MKQRNRLLVLFIILCMTKYGVLQSTVPVSGDWGQWDEWSSCKKSCDCGEHMRVRVCNDPVPQGDGLLCLLMNSERRGWYEVEQRSCCQDEQCFVPCSAVEDKHIKIVNRSTTSITIEWREAVTTTASGGNRPTYVVYVKNVRETALSYQVIMKKNRYTASALRPNHPYKFMVKHILETPDRMVFDGKEVWTLESDVKPPHKTSYKVIKEVLEVAVIVAAAVLLVAVVILYVTRIRPNKAFGGLVKRNEFVRDWFERNAKTTDAEDSTNDADNDDANDDKAVHMLDSPNEEMYVSCTDEDHPTLATIKEKDFVKSDHRKKRCQFHKVTCHHNHHRSRLPPIADIPETDRVVDDEEQDEDRTDDIVDDPKTYENIPDSLCGGFVLEIENFDVHDAVLDLNSSVKSA